MILLLQQLNIQKYPTIVIIYKNKLEDSFIGRDINPVLNKLDFLSEDWYPKYETGIVWNDKTLGIKWGIKQPIISKKDSALKNFSDL